MADHRDPPAASPAMACRACGRISGPADAGILIAANVRALGGTAHPVWRCPGCASINSAAPAEAVDYRDYPVHAGREDIWQAAALDGRLRRLAGFGYRLDQPILDFGCGSGAFVRHLRRLGAPAQGYDPHAPAWDDPRPLGRTWPVVASQDVIEHAEDPSALLGRMAGLVAPGGLLVIGTPCADAIDLDAPRRYSLELHQPYHRCILSRSALRSMGLAAGLVPLGCDERFYAEGWLPGMNLRFSRAYVDACGGWLDGLFEPIRMRLILRSPRLLALAMLGGLRPAPGNMTMGFRRPA